MLQRQSIQMSSKAEYFKKWYEANKEKVRKRVTEYQNENRKLIRANNNARYYANIEENREKAKISSKKYRERQAEARREKYMQNLQQPMGFEPGGMGKHRKLRSQYLEKD